MAKHTQAIRRLFPVNLHSLSQDQQNVDQFNVTVAFYPLPIPQPVNIKHQKTGDFLMFSRGVEGAQWYEIG